MRVPVGCLHKYTLDWYIEMDEGFFEDHRKKQQDGSAAKKIDRQVKAAVTVSCEPVAMDKCNKHPPATKVGFVKLNVVKNVGNKE